MKTIEEQFSEAINEYNLAVNASERAVVELQSMRDNNAPPKDIRFKERIYFEVLKPKRDSAGKLLDSLDEVERALIPIRKDIIRYKAVIALSVLTSCVYWGVKWFQ